MPVAEKPVRPARRRPAAAQPAILPEPVVTEPPAAVPPTQPLSPAERNRLNRAAKSVHNAAVAESASRTALVLGGGAPNSALMAGALAAFADRGVQFDVVSASGAGGLIGLLWLAPRGMSGAEALRNWVNAYVSDAIYDAFPVDYKVFFKPGAAADAYRALLNANPWVRAVVDQRAMGPAERLWSDWLQLVWATLSPTGLSPADVGLCARVPWAQQLVDFDRVKEIEPYFYLNAYDLTRSVIADFGKDEITLEHFRAAFAFPFIYGPYTTGGSDYYEGAVRDCMNFKDLVERHPGLETIVVFDVLGVDNLIRRPRNLYDSWVLSMVIPLVKTAEDNLELFALKHNGGWRRSAGARTDILKVPFPVPEADLPYVLDWSRSNGERLFDIGYRSGLAFLEGEGVGLLAGRAAAG